MTDDDGGLECDYDGCTRPVARFRSGKGLCVDHYNEEYRRRQRRRTHP